VRGRAPLGRRRAAGGGELSFARRPYRQALLRAGKGRPGPVAPFAAARGRGIALDRHRQGAKAGRGGAGAQSARALGGAAGRAPVGGGGAARAARGVGRSLLAGRRMIRNLNIILIFPSALMLAGVYALKFSIENTASERTALIALIDAQEGELSLLKADEAVLSQPGHI